MKLRIPNFDDFIFESNYEWIPMTVASAKIVADGMIKLFAPNSDEIAKNKKIAELVLAALEKHIERMKYFDKFPDFKKLIEDNVKHIIANDKRHGIEPEDPNMVKAYAMEYAMETIYERTKGQESQEEKDKKTQVTFFNKVFNEGAALRTKAITNAGLKFYKQNLFAFEEINRKLRTDHSKMSEHDWSVATDVGNAIDLFKTSKEVTVFRIIDSEDFPFSLSKGKKFTEKGILSTSFDINYLLENKENFESPVILQIVVPSGTTYYRFPNDFESEVVFDCDHEIIITDNSYEYLDTPIIKCKIIK
ncbi:MAG: hypothetical protein WC979_02580 [Candidatus Pacearchaeota archaeon]|jgi:hypothetical protein|nr:hypothetical protein [Clostridia bacterium]